MNEPRKSGGAGDDGGWTTASDRLVQQTELLGAKANWLISSRHGVALPITLDAAEVGTGFFRLTTVIFVYGWALSFTEGLCNIGSRLDWLTRWT